MPEETTKPSRRVLDPAERISEVLFGLIMVLTFTGSLSIAEAGREDIRAMLIGAVGCNIAWGIIDGVFYLMGVLAERGRDLATYRAVRQAADCGDAAAGHRHRAAAARARASASTAGGSAAAVGSCAIDRRGLARRVRRVSPGVLLDVSGVGAVHGDAERHDGGSCVQRRRHRHAVHGRRGLRAARRPHSLDRRRLDGGTRRGAGRPHDRAGRMMLTRAATTLLVLALCCA